jgi:ribosomal protein S12 methylthiotransferase accessory factor
VLNMNPDAVDIAAPIVLRGREHRAVKRFVGGTHRTAPPEETYERIRPHFKTAGITRLADVTGLDRIGIPTALAFRPNSPTLSNSSGKGFLRVAALVSGAMEGIELYHAENPRLPVRRATYAELEAGGHAIPRDRLLLSQGSLFTTTHPELWVEGWDIVGQRPMWAPFSQVAMVAHPDTYPALWMPFPMSSNGLASGNVMIETLCAALLEVIERDAMACHVMARRHAAYPHPRIRLETIRFPMVLDLLDRFHRAQIGVTLYDLTVDTDVPVFMAAIYDRVDRHVGMYSGYGAHLDPEIAMIRALTEAVQSRLIYIAGSRDDYFRHDYLKHRLHDGVTEVAVLESQPAEVDVSARRSQATTTFEGDVGVVIEKLRRVGLDQVIVVDLTHEEVGIPVARVIVPGLEGCVLLQNYAPGARAKAFVARHAKPGA